MRALLTLKDQLVQSFFAFFRMLQQHKLEFGADFASHFRYDFLEHITWPLEAHLE